MSPCKRALIKSAPRIPKRQGCGWDKLKECFIARNVPRASKETLALMESKTLETATEARCRQNPLSVRGAEQQDFEGLLWGVKD